MDGEDFPLRQEIVVSWFRSASSGVQADHLTVPFEPDIIVPGRLSQAAEPVLERLAEDLGTTANGVLLSDHRGQVLVRHAADSGLRNWLDQMNLAPGFIYAETSVGTNAIGTALAVEQPFAVRGSEHFVQALAPAAGAAAPITDPRTGDPLGVLALAGWATEASPLMLTLVKTAAARIEERLDDRRPASGNTLQEHFLRARSHTRYGLVALNEATILANAAAARELRPTDHRLLWESLAPSVIGSRPVPAEISLAGGTWQIKSIEPVRNGDALLGVSVALLPPSHQPADSRGAKGRSSRVDRPTFGWGSLTATELSVAELVAEGMTNRQVAAKLYLSPHTVGFHLRKVFRKLEISSRVELTRLVVDYSAHRPEPTLPALGAGGFGRPL